MRLSSDPSYVFSSLLQQCRRPTGTFQPNYQVKAVKASNNWNNNEWKNNDWNNEWHGEKQPEHWTWTDEHGKVWRNEAHNCKEGVYTYVDKDNINVKVCRSTSVHFFTHSTTY